MSDPDAAAASKAASIIALSFLTSKESPFGKTADKAYSSRNTGAVDYLPAQLPVTPVRGDAGKENNG